MYDVKPASWTPRERHLWQRIAAHPFEQEGQALDFTRRLARDRGWSLPFARGAVEEYRRFCFLAVTSSLPATPSEEIDEVWHQHLIYSRDYWDAWCKTALGAPLHHDPTEGGPAAAIRFRMQYAETLARYEAWFGAPDPAYWPAAHRRFGARPRYRIVDCDRAVVLPRLRGPRRIGRLLGRAWAALGVSTVLLLHGARPAQAETLRISPNPFDWPADPFLKLYAALCAAAIILALVRVWALRHEPSDHTTEPLEVVADKLDLVRLALLAGGRKRAADTVLVGLVDAGVARVTVLGRFFTHFRSHTNYNPGIWFEIEVDMRDAVLVEPFPMFRNLVQGQSSYLTFMEAIDPGIAAIEEDMTHRGLIPSRSRVIRTWWEVFIAIASVSTFGFIKAMVGFNRGKPFAYITILTFFTIIVSVVICSFVFAGPIRTERGRDVLRWFRERFGRAASSPREHELLFAFAMSGAAVLLNTHLSHVGRLILSKSPGTSGDGGGGSGGDGGGGCGGCGGGGN